MNTDARLFCMEDPIGTLEQGTLADLILMDGDPLADIAVLIDASRILLAAQGGTVVKDRL